MHVCSGQLAHWLIDTYMLTCHACLWIATCVQQLVSLLRREHTVEDWNRLCNTIALTGAPGTYIRCTGWGHNLNYT